MGNTRGFSTALYSATLDSKKYSRAVSHNQVFKSRQIDPSMDPKDITLRECRVSEKHPDPLPIVIALDVTGSMGKIPFYMVKEGLPKLVTALMERGVQSPQILFLAIGDVTCDSAPLQVGQFEASDELLLHWLENTYIEGGGGGNTGESYNLGLYFAGYHTAHDRSELKGKKGYYFSIGDEPFLEGLNKYQLETVIGRPYQEPVKSNKELLEKAQELYKVHHLHLTETYAGNSFQEKIKQQLGQVVTLVSDYNEIADVIASLIIDNEQLEGSLNQPVVSNIPSDSSDEKEMEVL